jgi:hypothetical protein
MANIYVRSTDGSDVDNGSTWALAKASLVGAAGIDAAGDTIYVSDNHAESTAGAVTIAFAGTPASPMRIICGDDAAEPPTAVASTGTVTTTGTANIDLSGSFYAYGLTLSAGTGAGSSSMFLGNGSNEIQEWDTCNFQLVSTGANGRMEVGCETTAMVSSAVRWKNCGVKFANASHGIAPISCDFVWNGGSVISGSTAITGGLFKGALTIAAKPSSSIRVESVDFSNVGAAFNLFDAASSISRGTVRNCRLPASWSGALRTGTMRASQRFEMYNCDNADTNYRLWIDDYAGSIVHETTIVRSGGANDGTTDLSWKMTATANASYPLVRLESPEIVKWNDTVGSAQTCTVEIVHDSQGSGTSSAFTDAEVWLDLQYLGTSGVPLGSILTDAKTSVLATAADQTSSSETWTTTGLTTPLKQKVAVTFTAREVGFIHAKVVLAKASAVCYVDPKLTVA